MNNKRDIPVIEQEHSFDDSYDWDSDECRYSWDDVFQYTERNEGYAKLCSLDYAQLIGAEWDSPKMNMFSHIVNIKIIEEKFDGGSSISCKYVLKGVEHEDMDSYNEHMARRKLAFEKDEKLEKGL